MTTKLTSNDLSTQAKTHREVAEKLINSRAKLQAKRKKLIDTNAPQEERNKIDEEIEEMSSRISKELNKANEINAKVITNILVETDLQNAKTEIEKARQKVLAAVDNLNNIKKTLKLVDLFINLGGAIASASIGNTAAKIKAIVKNIDAL